MAKVQKTYTREFKEEAVRLAQTSGKPITPVGRSLGISDTSIHQWRKEQTQHGTEAFPGSGQQTALQEEKRRLKRELERVQQEREILKNVLSIFSREATCAYQFIEQHKQECAIVVICHVLGVAESGLYACRKRPTSQRTRADALLTQQMRQVLEKHQGRYGSPRIQRELRDQGRSLSRKRVARLLGEAEIAARRKHRRLLTSKRDTPHPVAAHVFHREFPAIEPHTKWGTDITSSPTTQGWLSLAVIWDVYSRAVVGWCMSDCCDEQ